MTIEYLYKFFSMGGYGYYIWPAYSVVFLALLLIFLTTNEQLKAAKNKTKEHDE